MSEWLLFNSKWAIVLLYHDDDDEDVHYVLDQYY